MKWAARYIGLPYAEGGRGPWAFDCWGLVKLIYWQQFDILLPDLPGISAASVQTIHAVIRESAKQEWSQVTTPFDGCAVAMSQSKAVHHVGVFVGEGREGRVLHCRKHANASADTLENLRLRGFRTIQFYRHHLWPTS